MSGNTIINDELSNKFLKAKNNPIKKYSNLEICSQAMKNDSSGFKNLQSSEAEYVNEAWERNLTIYKCNNLIASEKIRLEKIKANEQKKLAEQKRIAEEKRLAEEKKLIEEKKREELAKLEAEREFQEKNAPKRMGSGSGFFINENGYIVSNFHVTDGCLEVKLGNEKLEIIRNDIVNDIAVLKSLISNENYISINKGGAEKGEDIFVLGFPHGKHLSSESKVTAGIVSALQGLGNNYSQMQIDAAIQPGNSGGPVINDQGELVGITVATADYEVMFEMFKSLPQNMNFAIKSQMLTNILEGSKISYHEPETSWFSFGTKDNKKTIAEADKATVYLECWSTEIAMEEAKKSAAKLVDTVNSD